MATTETILEATIKAGVEHFGGFPSGTMIAFAGKSVPDGWLLCNGALVSRTTYAKLFAAIGTAWGAGDGRTTFKLPDADGRVMQGVTDASKVGKYLEAGLPNLTGAVGAAGASTWQNATGVFSISGDTVNVAEFTTRATSKTVLSFSAKTDSALFSGKSTVQPKALQALIIIKA